MVRDYQRLAPVLLSLPQQTAPSGPRGLGEGRAGRGARDIVTTGGVSRQPLEAINEAQHIRHEYVGGGEGAG